MNQVNISNQFYFLKVTLNDSSLLTYLLTYLLHGAVLHWEADRFSASQEIPRISRNPKVHYRTHKRPPPVSILDQPNPVHNPTSHFLKIHLNIILPSMSGSPQWSLTLRFPHQNPLYASPLPHTCYMPCPSHCSRLYRPNNTGWAVQIIKLPIQSHICQAIS